MKCVLTRDIFTNEETLGILKVYDNTGKELYSCYTLECARGDYGKKCAIAPGKYQIILTHSNRFNKILPEVVRVKGRSGIRFHAGNTAADTTGCILVGEERGGTGIWRSRPALAWLMSYLNWANDKKEKIFLEIEEKEDEQRD